MNTMENLFTPEDLVGLVGVGKLGTRLLDEARKQGCQVILCDPPRAWAEADELSDTFFDLWGNGMGGCQLTNVGMETFVPLSSLARATLIAIQVPLTTLGRFATAGMITADFLATCRPDARIYCFSDPGVIAPEARRDPRIILVGE